MKNGLCPIKQLDDCQWWHFLAVAVRMLIGLSLGALFHCPTSFYVIPSSFVMSWQNTCLRLIPNRMCSTACLRTHCVRINSKQQTSSLSHYVCPDHKRRSFQPQDIINQWLVCSSGVQVQVASNLERFSTVSKKKGTNESSDFMFWSSLWRNEKFWGPQARKMV